MSEDYATISLPKSFVRKIDEVVENKEFGYSSRAELIKEAIRKLLLEYGVKFGDADKD